MTTGLAGIGHFIVRNCVNIVYQLMVGANKRAPFTHPGFASLADPPFGKPKRRLKSCFNLS